MRSVVLYWSKTGNTHKAALAVVEGLRAAGCEVSIGPLEEAAGIDWFDYDLICLGFPSYQWHPPKPVVDYLQSRFALYRRDGAVKTGAPRLPGKHTLILCTYSGPHTGLDEALLAGKYAGQFFAHLGFAVEEWYVPGEFHGSEEYSTQGPLGDLRGRPNAQDLAEIRERATALAGRLMAG